MNTLDALLSRQPALPPYRSPWGEVGIAAKVIDPSTKISPADAAARFRRVHVPGGYSGPWRHDVAPYAIDPMNCTADRRYKGVVLVGPAQSLKTDALVVNTVLHRIIADPSDMLIVETTQATARDFSVKRLDRLHRSTPEVKDRLMRSAHADNVHDKRYRGGMFLTIGWPSVTVLSGRHYKTVVLTDYDRMPEDVNGEGSPFDLAWQRPKTFGSSGCVIAESSPGRPIIARNWQAPASEPHKAPPATGILSLYNRGTRARWVWPCPHCNDFFEGSFACLTYPENASPAEAAAAVVMSCPSCGSDIEPAWKADMNANGLWLHEGQAVISGKATGNPNATNIASFWLKGPAAAFQPWDELVSNYLTAKATLEATRDEEPLKTTVNTDQAEPFLSTLIGDSASLEADNLRSASEPFDFGIVPATARFLTAQVDVQKNRFVVQVDAWGVAGERWLIDRFDIFASPVDDTRAIDPARYIEDWAALLDLESKTYPVTETDLRLAIVRIAVDSGGAAGTTSNAYDFWRSRRKAGTAGRWRLVKGVGADGKSQPLSAPRVLEKYPDAQRRDRQAAARGEVPVLMLNTNLLKDDILASLTRDADGAGRYHLSSHTPSNVFDEFAAEERTTAGYWDRRVQGTANEAFDLAVYGRALFLHLKGDRLQWENPPAWAAPIARNVFAVRADQVVDAVSIPAPKQTPKRRSNHDWLGGRTDGDWL